MDVIDQILVDLGLDKGLASDPDLLGDILRDTMFLADFEAFRTQVASSLCDSVDLSGLVARVVGAVRHRCPLLVEVLDAGRRDGLRPANAETVVWMIHYMYLLEALAQCMVERPAFLVALRDHVHFKRESLEIPGGFFGFVETVHEATGGGLFEGAKVRTLDLVVSQYIDWRSREPGPLPEGDLFRKNAGLKLNIMEAVVKDVAAGFGDNARVGGKLALVAVRSAAVVGESRVIKQALPPGWVALYQSWNLAFLMANLDNLDLLLPKLLIPSVLDAEPDDYLFRRGIVLWYVANMALLGLVRDQGVRRQRVRRLGLWADQWGQRTLHASEGFLAEHLGRPDALSS